MSIDNVLNDGYSPGTLTDINGSQNLSGGAHSGEYSIALNSNNGWTLAVHPNHWVPILETANFYLSF
jgi:hypothetical protein